MDKIDEKLFFDAFHLANTVNKDRSYKIPIPKSSKESIDIWETFFDKNKIKISSYVINVINGSISRDFLDFNIPSLLKNLTLNRFYDSESRKIGLFGLSWSFEYEASNSFSDKNGNNFEIRYIDSSNLIDSIVTSSGKKLTFNYKDNKIEKITDNIGRSVKYVYENDLLTEVVQANGSKYRFFYDHIHKKLSKVIDPNNNTEIEVSYDRYGKLYSII